jgi:calcineurin-like phosphoesterase family protein
MVKTWVYSDPHFDHANICTFTNFDGSPVRPWNHVGQMNEDMIRWYNEMVDDNDRVYILGDVAFSAAKMQKYVSQLKGRKVLVPGNHEPPKMRKYFDLFDDVRGYVVKKGFIMSHIPIHPESLARWELNIHGHTHANAVRVNQDDFILNGKVLDPSDEDPRYFCACVERTNFRPILLDDILKMRNINQQA